MESSFQRTIYQLSGKMGMGFVLILPIGFLAALLIGYIHGYLTVYNPLFGIVSIFLTVGFGFLLGAIISTIGGATKCRNLNYQKLMGGLLGIIALYISWATAIYASANRGDATSGFSLFSLVLNPEGLWAIVNQLNVSGWFSIKGNTPTGILLWIFWGSEAITVIVLSAFMAGSTSEKDVFCENCDQWTDDSGNSLFSVPNDTAALESLEKGEFNAITSLESYEQSSENPHINLLVNRCSKCKQTGTFKMDLITYSVDKEGKKKESKIDLCPNYSASREELDQLMTMVAKPEST